MVRAGEGVGLAVGIEDDQGDRNFIEVQLVNEAIAGLACQVPQEYLAVLLASITKFDFTAVEGPDVAAMG